MNSKAYYERYWSPEGFNPSSTLSYRLRDLLQTFIPPTAKILDVGCGYGRKIGLWAKHQDYDYLGVDISDNAVREAQSHGLNVQTIDDATSLPFADDSFDAVTCSEVLEHLFQPEIATAEMFRVLKPGGVLIVTVPNVVHWARRIEFALMGRWNPIGDHLSVEQPWRDPHLRFFTLPVLRRMIERSGLEIIEAGGHAGGFLHALPRAGRWFRGREGSRAYKRLERLRPELFAVRLHMVARKPGDAGATSMSDG